MSQFDIETLHPLYEQYIDAWTLMRDAFGGEDEIKKAGEKYLPMKLGTAAIEDVAKRNKAYQFYKLYAEFPDLVALTVRGAVGTILDRAAMIELPRELESLREKATRDGLTLDALHRSIATELVLTGRYGLLPGIAADGTPHLAGYIPESIINWSETDRVADYAVLDETGHVFDRQTGKWDVKKQYRQIEIVDGRYVARIWVDSENAMISGEEIEGLDRKRRPLPFLPLVFINVGNLTPSPDDVPLFGLAKLALRIYRMDANYQHGLYMTSEPTPWVAGTFDDQEPSRQPPSTVGASKLWVLPEGANAGMLEFTGSGLAAQQKAIEDAKSDAIMFGSQILTNRSTTAESGEAKRVRLDSQHSTLKTIAMNSAAGLERALKNTAIWIGADPYLVKVTPNLDFFDNDLSAQEITALVAGWQSAAYSKRTLFWNLQRGGVIEEGKSFEQEEEEISESDPTFGSPPTDEDDGNSGEPRMTAEEVAKLFDSQFLATLT